MLEQWFSKCGVGSLGGSSILSFWKYEFFCMFLFLFIIQVLILVLVCFYGPLSASSVSFCVFSHLLPSLMSLCFLCCNYCYSFGIFFVSLVLHLVLLRTFCLIVQIWFSCVLLPSCFHFPLLCRSSRVLRLSLCLSSLVRSLFFPLKFMDSFKFYVAICCAFGFLC